MITEFTLLIPLLILYGFGIIGWKTILIVAFTWYWLPKFLFLDMFLEKFYPQIITHNKNHSQHFDNNGNKLIALTFDDMPYGYHEQIIKLLDFHNMKGTFFIISSYVNDRNRQTLVNAVKNGHQLANHGKTNWMHAILSIDALVNEMYDCDQLIKKIYEEANVQIPDQMYYRPSCGLFTTKMLNIVKECDYKLALGSVYPNDPVIKSPQMNFWYIRLHIEPGDVVITHDRAWTPQMLQELLPYLTNNNYKSVTLNNLFNNK